MKTVLVLLLVAVYGIKIQAETEQWPCKGSIQPVSGLKEVKDDEFLATAIGAPEKGALCAGKVYEVTASIPVYRVYDKTKDYTLYGKWWSFSVPKGPRDTYRIDNDICPEWSPLDVMSKCFLKVGSKIALGPGQSAKCADGKVLPVSAMNQVFVPNDSRSSKIFVENCTPGVAWP